MAKCLYPLLLLALLSCNPDSQKNELFRTGDNYFNSSLYLKAINEYQKILNLDSTDSRAFLKIADCYDLLDEKMKAIEYYSKSIQWDTLNKIGYYNRAITFEEMARTESALLDYERAIKVDSLNTTKPDNKYIYQNLGILHGKLNRLDEAVKAFRSAIVIDSDYADAHFNLGFTLQQKGLHESAIKSFEQAIRIHPNEEEYKTQKQVSVKLLESNN
jgi:tetratricopeptide (TPR) repeat protein